MVIIWMLILLLCGTVPVSAAVVLSENDWRTLKRQARSNGPMFPTAPVINDLFLLTNDSAAGACDPTGGLGEVTLCRWTGSLWTAVAGAVSSPPAVTLDTAFDNGAEIDNATSANPVKIGNGTQKLEIFGDATLGGTIRPSPLGDSVWRIWTNFNGCIRDEEAATNILCIDPDASGNDKYVWTSGYRPIKTVSFTADAMRVAGSAALVADTTLVSGGLVSSYITVTDSNSDYFYTPYFRMANEWDGGTVTATVTTLNVNGTPANAFEVDVSGVCYPAGTAVATTIPTTGEQPATITYGSSGSCGGSACPQNSHASATTVAITVNGTPAGGNLCAFQGQVDATATTETVAGIKILQLDIHYKIGKGF